MSVTNFTATEWVQIICALVILTGVAGVIIQRLISGKGIGVRAIQFVAASALMPGILILSLVNKIDGATAAALIGAFIGYLFSSISKFDDK